ncbi:alpha-glucan family phosphorylase [Muribaculum intestinale]|uniref:alpha-glucan family phosphorylase n=1 Tax=Muribaculum intestinale TaxID=1796646 RepID=UPI000FFEF370|nr:alpha-glucan family phosphorylase [Muribaculum intestinale]RXE73110.1 glycosyltransferase family 1 protein [Muribaculaceae bacterium Isolate-013 (NCI)]
MKLQVSNTNAPAWRDITVKSELPSKLKPLEELAKNLWWVWNSEAKALFRDLNPELWRSTGENPVMVLQQLSSERLDEVIADKDMMGRLKHVYGMFKDYMAKPMRSDIPSVSYFSMEYGLCNALKIYSGGLGVLAGDYIKEASDSCVPMTAVGFLYRYGYFTQTLSVDGQQIANYEAQNFNQLPIEQVMDANGHPMIVEVPYPGRTIYSHVWRVNVGRMKLYLMDTDFEMNSELDRPITHQLYGGDWENRIKQEYLLGIGGVIMLKKLGVNSELYHCNEGHAALLNLQRLVDFVQEKHLDFQVALELVRASSLYTVHTPVPAGHDYFDEGLFGKYMGEYPAKLGISWNDLMNMGRENPNTNERFSMSVFALNTCQEANGVSWLHGEVSKKMFAGIWKGYNWRESHVGYVTNGVHMPTWAASEWKEFYAEKLGEQVFDHQEDPEAWKGILKCTDQEIWNMRMTMKNKFINFVKRDFKAKWLANQGDPTQVMHVVDKINPNALIIGFARRFATYKRAHLLFTDLDRLAKIVNNEQFPVQFVFSGKAHPADGAGQGLIKRIMEISRMPQFLGKIIFLEDYNMIVAKRLVTGVDIWLNTPTRPLEASGTSGEKAEMNGVLNFSVLDGWWYEGYRFDEKAGWALTDKRTYTDQAQQDKLDAATIYSMLENEIVPLYYAKNSKGYSPEWVQYIKRSIAHIAPHFTMKRMIDDYIERFYTKEAARTGKLAANDYAKAKEIVAWKEKVAAAWDGIKVFDVESSDVANSVTGTDYTVRAIIDANGLGRNLGLELVVYKKEGNEENFAYTKEFDVIKEEGNVLTYQLNAKLKDAGVFRYGFRLFPKNADLPHRMDFAYTRWI